jgi:hypothetical protein
MQTTRMRGASGRVLTADPLAALPGDWRTWLGLVLFWLTIFLSPLLYDAAQRAAGA